MQVETLREGLLVVSNLYGNTNREGEVSVREKKIISVNSLKFHIKKTQHLNY